MTVSTYTSVFTLSATVARDTPALRGITRFAACAGGAARNGTPASHTDEDELEDEFAENSSGSAAPKVQKRPILSVFCTGGAEGVEPLRSSLRSRGHSPSRRYGS